jgi:hypothetical protein
LPYCSSLNDEYDNFNLKSYKTMKFTYYHGVAAAAGEISVVMSKDAEQMVRHCASLAAEIQRKGIGSMVINCGITERRFNEHFTPIATAGSRNIRPENRKSVPLIRHSTRRGDLVDRADLIREFITSHNVKVVVIMGWEWTSSSYRRSQELLYILRDLAETHDVSIIVYTQRISKAEPGKYDRSGIGRLGMLAVAVSTVDNTEESSGINETMSEPEMSVEDHYSAKMGVTLLINKINNLQGENAAMPASTDVSFSRGVDDDAAVLVAA